MPLIAMPMTNAAPTLARAILTERPERRRKKSHNAAKEAAMAMATEAARSPGS